MSEAAKFRGVMNMDSEDESEENPEESAKAEERNQILQNLALRIIKTRSEAIAGRAQCGIEMEWLQDEEHYEGIDDANRHEHAGWRGKPFTAIDPTTRVQQNGSTAFFNITRPYTDSASARMGDMLLPTDDRAWSIRPTPVPDMAEIAEGKIPARLIRAIEKDIRWDKFDAETRATKVEETKADLIKTEKERFKIATDRANRAQTRIEDWHVESQYQAEMRQVIEDTCRGGTGVLKGPVPMRKQTFAYVEGKLIMQSTTIPSSRRVDYWNCFPDPACGQSIHDGGFFWERDDITSKRLAALKGGDYLDDEIDRVIAEGPHRATKEFDGDEHLMGLVKRETTTMFEIWYFHGRVKHEDLESAGCEFDEGHEEKFDYDAVLTLVNNHVIKASLNLLDTGEFPYDFMVWQRRVGTPWGIGVPRQMRTPQRVVNGGGRNMMDNAGLAGGPMFVYMGGIIVPMDGKPELAPRKGWTVTDEATIEDVTKAFTFIEIPMMQKELQAIIQFGLKMAEDVTGMPMLMQGSQGSAPDTVGGMKILNENASSPMRRVARLFDDLITEPHVRRYYAYLLQYGESDDEKGDFQIDARGSTALVDRDLNNQAILQMANIVVNPVFGIDPKKWAQEFLKAQRLAPERFEYDDEEWQKVVEQMSAPPADSSLQIAQLRVEIDKMRLEQEAKDADADRQMEIAMKSLDVTAENKAHEMEIANKALEVRAQDRAHEMEIATKALDQQNDVRKTEGGQVTDLAKLQAAASEGDKNRKVKLVEVVMKLKAQMELERMNAGGQALAPPTEPKGRAPNGESFEK